MKKIYLLVIVIGALVLAIGGYLVLQRVRTSVQLSQPSRITSSADIDYAETETELSQSAALVVQQQQMATWNPMQRVLMEKSLTTNRGSR